MKTIISKTYIYIYAFLLTLPVVCSSAVPVEIEYSSFHGGSDWENIYDVAVHTNGYIYIVGCTSSTNLPVTSGAYDETYNGGEDAFFTVFKPGGTEIHYCTYLGGSSHDSMEAIALDSSGNIYVTGSTWSDDFPTTADAYDTSLNGGRDVFVAKFDVSGKNLIYSSYIGGNSWEYGKCIDVDDNNNAYLGGFTHGGYPTTSGAAQTTFGGASDGFVTKLNLTSSSLVYSTYIGGNSWEPISDVKVIDGIVYACSGTQSTNYPTTPGAFETENVREDGAFTVISADGSEFLFSTYIGPEEVGYTTNFSAIALDSSKNIYLVGSTDEESFVTTSKAIQKTFAGGNRDGILVKIKSDYSEIIYSTFLGGDGEEECRDVSVDLSGNIWITGYTNSTNFPTGTTAQGDIDTFNICLSSIGELLKVSRVGSSQADGVFVDYMRNYIDPNTNKIWYAGGTGSSAFPTTINAQQSSYGGGTFDGYLTLINQLVLTPFPTWTPPPTLTPTISATSTVTSTATITSTTTPTQQPPTLESDGFATPNPFFPARGQQMSFNFRLENPGSSIIIRIMDRNGKIIRTLRDTYEWDGRNEQDNLCEGGVYLYQIEVDNKRVAGQVVVLK